MRPYVVYNASGKICVDPYEGISGNSRYDGRIDAEAEIRMNKSAGDQEITRPVGTLTIGTEADEDVFLKTNDTARWAVENSTGNLTAQGGDKNITGVATPTTSNQAAPKGYVDITPRMLTFGNGSSPNAPGSGYLDPNWSDRQVQGTEIQIPIPFDMTVSKLTFHMGVAHTGDTLTIALRKNGSTIMGDAIDPGVTDGFLEDSGLDFDEDDLMSIMVTGAASLTTGFTNLVVSVHYVAR